MAELVEDLLAVFLAAQRDRPWAPGAVDCCLLLADWAIWLGHQDPAEHLRGTYSDDAGFEAIIAAAGGVSPLVAACVANINGLRVQRPLRGSVAVIGSHSNIKRQWGAIFDGSRWLVRFRDAVEPMVAKPLAIWEI